MKINASYLSVVLLACFVFVTGCSTTPPPMPGPVAVSGTAMAADGSPLKNVIVAFQPTETGHPAEMEINDKGEFSGELAQAKFIYYFVPSKKSKGDGMKAVPTNYQSPSMDNIVDVKQGAPIEIKLK